MPKRSMLVLAAVALVAMAASACRSLPEATGDDLDPAAIETAIRSGIAAQYPDETFDIGVEVTEDGVVTLTGTVEDSAQRNEIGDIAREVHDVERVINQLEVG